MVRSLGTWCGLRLSRRHETRLIVLAIALAACQRSQCSRPHEVSKRLAANPSVVEAVGEARGRFLARDTAGVEHELELHKLAVDVTTLADAGPAASAADRRSARDPGQGHRRRSVVRISSLLGLRRLSIAETLAWTIDRRTGGLETHLLVARLLDASKHHHDAIRVLSERAAATAPSIAAEMRRLKPALTPRKC
jgi:hypothetical protein